MSTTLKMKPITTLHLYLVKQPSDKDHKLPYYKCNYKKYITLLFLYILNPMKECV